MEVNLIAFFLIQILASQIIPLDDPAYETIDRLEAKGVLIGLPDSRPFLRSDIARAVVRDSSIQMSRSDSFDLQRILAPTPDCKWVPALKLSSEEAGFYLGGAVQTSYRLPDTLRVGPEIKYYGSVGPATFFAAHRITYAAGWPDTVFDAKSWRGDERPVFAEVPDARVDFDLDWLHVQAGRSQIQYGPVPDGGLFLSTQPWGLDHAAYTLKWKGVRFSTTYAWLQADKQMVVHRFEYVGSRWKLGLSEGVVSNDSNDVFAYLAAPVALYYFMQWNKLQDENILWGADASVMFPPVKLYGEFLVDDFAYEPATGPHKIGGTIGVQWVSILKSGFDVGVDYTAITKWTYAQRHDNQNYTFRGRILGDDLGPDADRLRFNMDWRIIPRLSLNTLLYLERQGEGDVWRDFTDDGAHDYETYHPPFPSGVVEQHLGAQAGLKFTVIGRSFISLTGQIVEATNLGNVADSNALQPSIQTSVYWEF